jgi:Transposase and inactivated derivatives
MPYSTVSRSRVRPEAIVIDNGPEFAGKASDAWSYGRGVALLFIRPGKPIENAFIAWKEDYNTARPHSALGYVPPAEYMLARNKTA